MKSMSTSTTEKPSSITPSASTRVRVWDLPTRVFHWGLVVCVAASYATVKLGGLWMEWHVRFGLATLALVLFRVAWGVVGPRYARFSQFVRGPRAILAYLRGRQPHQAGHNPLGALSVVALLAMFGIQAVTGLFTTDDVMTAGPLAYLSDTWSGRLTWLHDLDEWILVALVALHVAAILWYRLARGKNLVGPMLHGDVPADTNHPPPEPASDSWRVRAGALVMGLAAAAFVWWLTTLAPLEPSFM